ncbi:MAG TPA: hypothetical protein DHV36_03910, partial [Desulfobacteraceae bacterium]|nr:hypothetical protein [Desulfobacteraceae bacterium]
MKPFLGLLVIFLCIVSCASHKPISTTALTRGADAEDKKVSQDGIDLMISPIVSKAVMKAYFDQDLLAYGILPVQVCILNNTDAPLNLSTEAVCLMDDSSGTCPRLSVDKVVRRLKKSYWRSVGWGAALGLMGAIPSAINVGMTNEKIAFFYKTRALKTDELPVGTSTEGLVFFEIPDQVSALDGWTFQLRYRMPSHPKTRTLPYALAGD